MAVKIQNELQTAMYWQSVYNVFLALKHEDGHAFSLADERFERVHRAAQT